ncbi:MAG: alpha/beta hydrolase [Pyrinomonadaceae bacterium]
MIKTLTAIAICLLLLSACGRRPSPSPSDVKAGPAPTQPPSGKPFKTVEIDSVDGTPIYGSMYAADKPNSPALLLLHQWGRDRHSFDDFGAWMQSRGFAVLAIDGRGFGESNHHANGSMLEAGRTDVEVKAMLGDVDATFNYLSKQPNVESSKVAIVGASYGSSLAIIYAADHPTVAAVALLSPGLNYFGNMPTQPAVNKYGGRPLFMAAAEDDKESADSARALAAADPKAVQKIFPSGGHGQALFKVGVGDELEKFLTASLQK